MNLIFANFNFILAIIYSYHYIFQNFKEGCSIRKLIFMSLFFFYKLHNSKRLMKTRFSYGFGIKSPLRSEQSSTVKENNWIKEQTIVNKGKNLICSRHCCFWLSLCPNQSQNKTLQYDWTFYMLYYVQCKLYQMVSSAFAAWRHVKAL